MIIKNIKSDQFAGTSISGAGIEFEKGLNLLVGPNGSGKSTVADLIYYMLFKDTKIDGRKDAGFIGKYFPNKLAGPEGDVIDGELSFETPEGIYKLKKEWDKGGGEGSCRLILPDKTIIKNKQTIKDTLNTVLTYRAGVYNEIVFASQKREQNAIESIMGELSRKTTALSDTRMDLTSTIVKASLETGGVSLDKIEASLNEIMSELSTRWDIAADMPEGGVKRGINNKWSLKDANKGILKAFYEMEEIRAAQLASEEAEKLVEIEKESLQNLEKSKQDASEKRDKFQEFRSVITLINTLNKEIARLKIQIKEQEDILVKWPVINSNIGQAKQLDEKLKQAEIHEQYLKVKALRDVFMAKKSEFDKSKSISDDDISSVRDLQKKLDKAEGRLAGLDLVAQIKQLGTKPVEVKSISSGNQLADIDGEYSIKEAVEITVPDVLEIKLLPKGVDVEKIKSDIEAYNTEITIIYNKYGVNELSELEKLSKINENLKSSYEKAKNDLDRALEANIWEEIEAENKKIPEGIEASTEIGNKIHNLCGNRSIDAFVGGLEATLASYEGTYTDIENLKTKTEELKKDLTTSETKLNGMATVPAEFQNISDSDAYDKKLKDSVEQFEDSIKLHNDKLREAERKLGEKSSEEYGDELLVKTSTFEARKAEYAHWKKIYDAFLNVKNQTTGNPVADIEQKFKEYLEFITDGEIELSSIDDSMSVKLASGNYLLSFETLSEGSEDSISLAFRLAMLFHLYPEGNGLAVFDDPFTDMDPKRLSKACKLIQKFAENNQVIFMSCDDKYKSLLSGKLISF